jgi:hypothetical protein
MRAHSSWYALGEASACTSHYFCNIPIGPWVFVSFIGKSVTACSHQPLALLCCTTTPGLRHCQVEDDYTTYGHNVSVECVDMGIAPWHGSVGFDNIFQATATAFQIVTLEGWSAILYALQDAAGFWVWPFFLLLIILGSWLSLNLVLVVVATQFKITKRRCVRSEGRTMARGMLTGKKG